MNCELPKIIWTLWFQGFENAPLLVKKCMATWEKHNPNWTIRYLTNENLSQYMDIEALIPGYKNKEIPPESLSDVIRLTLLLKHGGVWVDSTLYCNEPLDKWLPQKMAESNFFAFSNPGPDRLLSTWFLAATPNHLIVQKWHQGSLDYWSIRDKRHTYFWCHYTFGDLYNTNEEFKLLWDKTPKLSADKPHYFCPYDSTFYPKPSLRDLVEINKPTTPVFKLTHKYDESLVSKNSTVHYLLSNDRYFPNLKILYKKIINKLSSFK